MMTDRTKSTDENEERARLKLAALDEEDLAVMSAHIQDAVMLVGDLVYTPRKRQFTVAMNRFAWDMAVSNQHTNDERRLAVLAFSRVKAVRSHNVPRAPRDRVLSLLAIRYEPIDPPSGRIRLEFAGGGTLALDVECIEARLADLGAAWAARGRPCHPA